MPGAPAIAPLLDPEWRHQRALKATESRHRLTRGGRAVQRILLQLDELTDGELRDLAVLCLTYGDGEQ